jgi:putative hydrolase of the HAD superfamily
MYTGRLERPPTTDDHERAHWQRIVSAVLCELPDAGGQPFELLWQHFAEPRSWRLYGDVEPALARLLGLGLVLGIASNFDCRLHRVVRGLGPLSACSHTFVSSEIGFSKPDPRFFAAVAARLGLLPDQILLVGDDRMNDLEGATAAGLRAVLVNRDASAAGTGVLQSLLSLIA